MNETTTIFKVFIKYVHLDKYPNTHSKLKIAFPVE